jgi:myo-inositol-1(or 4)-monophosphatase
MTDRSPADPADPAGAADSADLLALACSLARAAGSMAAEGRRGGVPAGDTKSTATDMVTEFDRASERLIVEGLRAARPGDGLIGEEGSSHEGTSGIDWLVDPIDGTTNFLYDLPGWAVSIAAADRDGRPAKLLHVAMP